MRRQQQILVELVAERLETIFIDIVVGGETVVAHGGDDLRGNTVIVPVQPLPLTRREDGVVRCGKLVAFLVDVEGRETRFVVHGVSAASASVSAYVAGGRAGSARGRALTSPASGWLRG